MGTSNVRTSRYINEGFGKNKGLAVILGGVYGVCRTRFAAHVLSMTQICGADSERCGRVRKPDYSPSGSGAEYPLRNVRQEAAEHEFRPSKS